MVESRVFDTVVIGGGAGGHAAAIRLAQLGKRTALIEKESLAGVSLDWGCISSKALVAAASVVEDLRGASERGLSGEPRCAEQCTETLDLARMRAVKDGVVARLARRLGTRERGHGVEVIRGTARFVSAKAIAVEAAGGTTTVEASAFVIATGARPILLPGFDGQDVWTPREAVELREIPRRLVVVGGGAIGLEIGTAYAKLGSRVTVVDAARSILSGIDPDVVPVVRKGLRRRGITVHESTRATGLERDGGRLHVRTDREDDEQLIFCTKVLVALGSAPNTHGLGLEAAGVKLDRRGFVEVNDRMETSAPGIYGVGDVAGPPFLAHKASNEGEIAAETIAGTTSGRRCVSIPNVVFTDPEVAAVGLSEDDARAEGHDPIVRRLGFAALGRALAIGRSHGFVKVVADRDSRLLLGVVIVGPQACDLIAEASLALQMSATLDDVALTVHAHPTLSEAFVEACKVALGAAIHASNRPAQPVAPLAPAALVRRSRGVRR
jgi:dihydrolipoamide dehydrogenase